MLARLQQTITMLILLAVAGCTWWTLTSQSTWPGIGALAFVLTGHAAALAVEFVGTKLNARRSGAALAPSWWQLARAWWAESLIAPTVFLWRQPYRSRAHPDHLPATAPHQRVGVLLIHGFFCNRGFWNDWLKRLIASDTTVVAINLEPVFGSIEHYPAIIEDAVRRLERSTARPPIAVAHSMGGLALRAWLARQGNSNRISHAITLGSPHHGTELARIALSENGRQMRPASAWLTNLAEVEDRQGHRPPFTCYYSHCDNIVFPTDTATLPGAENIHLPATAHVHMAYRSEPWARLRELLEAASDKPAPPQTVNPPP